MGFLRPEVGVSVGFVLFMQLSMLAGAAGSRCAKKGGKM
jgi:hypothetical protein